MLSTEQLAAVRDRFHHVDTCPYGGPRAFFENAGGSLTLKSVVSRAADLLTLPDNQGRANAASAALAEVIAQGRADMMTFFGASSGQVFIGETGTELLGRLIRSAALAAGSEDGSANVVGSHLEHPATFSACRRWASIAGLEYRQVPFDAATSVVGVDQYRPAVDGGTAVATIIHASPVTGMHVDVASVAALVREQSPEAFIIVDGIQHAAHGAIDIDSYGIDGYVVSGYKMFSRHNYGVAWVSDRLGVVPHDQLDGSPPDVWEMGTRDVSAYASCSEVVRYLEWLGEESGTPEGSTSRQRLEAASAVIRAQEHRLVDTMLNGTETLPGLAQLDTVRVVGPVTSEHRSGMVSFEIDGYGAAEVVAALEADGVRTHARKRDAYSAGVLVPLGVEDCVRASVCHYNTVGEVERFLATVVRLAGA